MMWTADSGRCTWKTTHWVVGVARSRLVSCLLLHFARHVSAPHRWRAAGADPAPFHTLVHDRLVLDASGLRCVFRGPFLR